MSQTKAPEQQHTGRATPLPRLLACLLLASAAPYAVFNAIQPILLPAQIARIDPDGKIADIAVITTVVAITCMFAPPLAGVLSDRTRSRFGRRTPWIAGSGIVGALFVLAMGAADSVWMLGLTAVGVWFAMNFFAGVTVAIVPDRVPESRRGVASAIVGLAAPLGIVYAANTVSHLGHSGGYALTAVSVLVLAAVLIFGAREGSARDMARPVRIPKGEQREPLRRRFGAFFHGFSLPDFRNAFISRFFLYTSYYVATGYTFYLLTDYVGEDKVPGGSAAVGVSIILTVKTVVWAVVATLAGWISDKIDRRKALVGISALALAVAMLVPIFFPSWAGMLVWAVGLGVAYGTYASVDIAVMSLVLPDREHFGRDFGFLQIANGLPQLFTSIIAGVIIAKLGGYAGLFIFSGVCAVIAAVFMFRIRSIR